MGDTLEIIDQLIKEHRALDEKTRTLEVAVNDARLISDITIAKDTFIPGRFDQGEKLKVLEEMLKSIDIWLEKHFTREETALQKTVQDMGDAALIDSLNKLLFEHSDLRYRMAHSKKRVAELLTGDLQRNIWDATANDTRSYLSHTRKLLGTHAGAENRLFLEIRRKILSSVK